jgi:hypothetical protein
LHLYGERCGARVSCAPWQTGELAEKKRRIGPPFPENTYRTIQNSKGKNRDEKYNFQKTSVFAHCACFLADEHGDFRVRGHKQGQEQHERHEQKNPIHRHAVV